MRNVMVGLVVLVLTGCFAGTTVSVPSVSEIEVARLEQEVVTERWADFYRLKERYDSIAYVLAVNNLWNCPYRVQVERVGLESLTAKQFQQAPNQAVRFIPTGGEGLRTVQSVSPGSPASRVLQPGDILRDYAPGEPFRVHRPGTDGVEIIEATISPVRTCPIVRFIDAEGANAFATADGAFITSAMAEVLANDHEVALVMAHEMAHLIADHLGKAQQNAVIGGLIGAVLDELTGTRSAADYARRGAVAYSREFEAEADYLAAVLVARAGFDPETGAEFWLRVAGEAGLGYSRTHPSHVRRYVGAVARARTVAQCEERWGKVGLNIPNEYFEERVEVLMPAVYSAEPGRPLRRMRGTINEREERAAIVSHVCE